MSGPTIIKDWRQARPDEDAWECEQGHRRPVPTDLDPVHKYEPCRYPVGVKTACSASARLRKVPVLHTEYTYVEGYKRRRAETKTP